MTAPATPSRRSPPASSTAIGAGLRLGYESLGRIARALPRRHAYAAARRMMSMLWLAWPQGRAASLANAEALLPHVNWTGDAASLAQAQWRAYGEYLVDAVRLPELTPAQCFEAVDGDAADWARLRAAYGSRPTLFAVMHMGNWDALGGAYTHACGRSHVVVEPLGHPSLDRVVQSPRERLGMTPQAGASGVRRAIAALQAGGTAAILFDRPPRGRDAGIEVQLFGRPARLSSTLDRVAAATNAWIIPLAAVRRCESEFRFRALIDLDAEIEPSQASQRAASAFEPWLAAHPEQWYQFSRFFADQPLS